MLPLAFAGLLALAGCGSLGSDLQTAEAACAATPNMTPYVLCLNSAGEPVWQKDSPESVPAYRNFAATRLSLAQALDGGEITAAQFKDAAASARAKLAAVQFQAARNRQKDLDQQRAAEQVDGLGNKPQAIRGDMANGMSNGMGGGMGM